MAPSPEYGTFTITGAGLNESVEFHSLHPGPTIPGTGTGGTGSGDAAVWLLGIALAALFVGTIVLAGAIWRKNPVPPAPPPPPPPPAIWDEAG